MDYWGAGVLGGGGAKGMLAPLQNYWGGLLAPRSPSSYTYAVYPTFTFLQIQFVWPQYIQREREKERERVNDENYHEKREISWERKRELTNILNNKECYSM